MLNALTRHWPECLSEAALLGTFMVSGCLVASALHHPGSPAFRRLGTPLLRRAATGLLLGLTAVWLIYSPLGQRSGAHMNPGTTLTFLYLGHVEPWDAVFYMLAQCVGAATGVAVAAVLLGGVIRHRSVNYIVTSPGVRGRGAAWVAELVISFGMMLMVLVSTNRAATAPYTGLFAGGLVALYITFEAPLSGMSINPARSLASALVGRSFRALWIYFTAPPLGMLSAAVLYTAVAGADSVYCAKLHHGAEEPCIFRCRIDRMPGRRANPGVVVGIQDAGGGNASARAGCGR